MRKFYTLILFAALLVGSASAQTTTETTEQTESLQAQIEQYTSLLSVVGGIFVVIVGVYIFFQNPVPQIRKNRAGKSSLWQDFASIFGFTIANFVVVIPYILAFFAVFNIGTAESAAADVAMVLRSVLIIVGFFGGAP